MDDVGVGRGSSDRNAAVVAAAARRRRRRRDGAQPNVAQCAKSDRETAPASSSLSSSSTSSSASDSDSSSTSSTSSDDSGSESDSDSTSSSSSENDAPPTTNTMNRNPPSREPAGVPTGAGADTNSSGHKRMEPSSASTSSGSSSLSKFKLKFTLHRQHPPQHENAILAIGNNERSSSSSIRIGGGGEESEADGNKRRRTHNGVSANLEAPKRAAVVLNEKEGGETEKEKEDEDLAGDLNEFDDVDAFLRRLTAEYQRRFPQDSTQGISGPAPAPVPAAAECASSSSSLSSSSSSSAPFQLPSAAPAVPLAPLCNTSAHAAAHIFTPSFRVVRNPTAAGADSKGNSTRLDSCGGSAGGGGGAGAGGGGGGGSTIRTSQSLFSLPSSSSASAIPSSSTASKPATPALRVSFVLGKKPAESASSLRDKPVPATTTASITPASAPSSSTVAAAAAAAFHALQQQRQQQQQQQKQHVEQPVVEDLSNDAFVARHVELEEEERELRRSEKVVLTWAICDDPRCRKWRVLSETTVATTHSSAAAAAHDDDEEEVADTDAGAGADAAGEGDTSAPFFCGHRTEGPCKADCDKPDDWIVRCVDNDANVARMIEWRAGVKTVEGLALPASAPLRAKLREIGFVFDPQTHAIRPLLNNSSSSGSGSRSSGSSGSAAAAASSLR